MSYTPEQLAIRQYLEKPLSGAYACGCVGRQPIEDEPGSAFNFELKIKSYPPEVRKEVIQAIRRCSGLGLIESKLKLDNGDSFNFDDKYYCAKFKNELEYMGVQCEVIENKPLMYPYCPCAMRNVMEVEGNFYEVVENRSAEGVTHDAYLIGPIGGPYELR